jgi:Mrp family chromosome partitioning ATPase
VSVAADPSPASTGTTALAPFRGGAGGESVSLLAVGRDGQLVASPSPERTTADGYLRLTARILLEAERTGFRTIGVISALDGEGRTTAAINLAVCLGRARGRSGRVLLVDGSATRCSSRPRSRAST